MVAIINESNQVAKNVRFKVRGSGEGEDRRGESECTCSSHRVPRK